jgi:hypothetical protein
MYQRAWHQALAYAVTGQRRPELGYQEQPDIAELAGRIRHLVDPDARVVTGRLHRVPDDLMRGLGAAQFQAGLTELRSLLAESPAGRVVADRPLTAEERRLDADRPPHHR